MYFAHPAMLLFLAAIPLVVLLHSMRKKPLKMTVTTLFLLDNFSREKTFGSYFSSVKQSLLLFLQILIIIFIAIALAKPVITYKGYHVNDVILVLDLSASMQAHSDRFADETRFNTAFKKAFDIISRKKTHQRIALIASSSRPSLVHAPSTDRNSLVQALTALRPETVSGNLTQALEYAQKLSLHENIPEILYITDPQGFHSLDSAKTPSNAKPFLVAEGTDNIAILQFSVRRRKPRSASVEFFLQIKNYIQSDISLPLRLMDGDTLIYSDTIPFASLEEKNILLKYQAAGPAVIQAFLDYKDNLDIDNTAWAVIPSYPRLKVLLLTKGNPFLENLLSTFHQCTVRKFTNYPEKNWDSLSKESDIVILDRMNVPRLHHKNTILIDAYSSDCPIIRKESIPISAITDWEEKNPLFRHIAFDNIRIRQAYRTQCAQGCRNLLWADTTALLIRFESATARGFYFSFDFLESDLVLRSSFPLLMLNMFSFFNPYFTDLDRYNQTTGTPLMVVPTSDSDTISLTLPDQITVHLKSDDKTVVPFAKTVMQGIYSSGKSRWAVNLSSRTESDINGILSQKQNNAFEMSLQKEFTLAENSAAWRIFTMLLLLLLIVEVVIWERMRK